MNNLIANSLERTRHNQDKILGILNYCHLPIRRFPSKSFPHHNMKSKNYEQSSESSKYISKLPSLSNLITKNVTNEIDFLKMNQHKNFLNKILAIQYRKKNDQIEIKSSIFERITKPDLTYRFKSTNSKRKTYKYHNAMVKLINERETMFTEFKESSRSEINIDDIESLKLVNSGSFTSKLTKITSVKEPESFPRLQFLQEEFSGNLTLNKKEIEDTMYGIDENLESNSLTVQDDHKAGISTISHYVTANSDCSSNYEENRLNIEKNIPIDKSNKRIYVSVYEKEFQKLHILYPTIQNVVDGSYKILQIIPEDRSQPLIMDNRFFTQSVYISHNTVSSNKINKLKLILKQSNNNNNDEEQEISSIDNHQYFRRAQQLLSNNSSQMQYLIYGFDKTKNELIKEKKLPKKLDIQVFKDGERMEPPENLDNLKSRLFNNSQITDNNISQKLKIDFNKINDDKLQNLNIDAIISCSNDKKKPQPGPALKSYLQRRQRCRIEAQEKDHNLMLSRARMIKCDYLKSEFDSNVNDRETLLYSPDEKNSMKTNTVISHYEQNQLPNKKSKTPIPYSSSNSGDESSSYLSDNHQHETQLNYESTNDSKEESIKNNKKCQRINKNFENISLVTNQHSQSYIREDAIQAELNSLSSNNSVDGNTSQIPNEDQCPSTLNNEHKHVTFHEDDVIISTNKFSDNSSNQFEQNSRNENKFVYPVDNSIILTKLSYMEQQISILTIMLSNILHKINDLDINLQELSTTSMNFFKESFGLQHNGNSYFDRNYHKINHLLNNGISSIPHWNNGF